MPKQAHERSDQEPHHALPRDSLLHLNDFGADAFFSIDTTWRICFASSGDQAFQAEACLGRFLWEVLPERDDRDRESWREYRRCMEQRVPASFVVDRSELPGRREVRVYPDASGGLNLFLHGVSESKGLQTARASSAPTPGDAFVAERVTELHAMFERLSNAVLIATPTGIALSNSAAAAMFGYRSKDELRGNLAHFAQELCARDVITDERLRVDELPLAKALAGEANERELLVRHRQHGTDRVLRFSAAPITVGGRIVAAISVGSDVTERLSAEAEERRRSELEQQLIGIVSHDLRNPLQVIRFAATLGQKLMSEDAQQRRLFERIMASSDRALSMINTLLDFTRIRFGGFLHLEPKEADLHAVMQHMVDEVLMTRPERSVSIERTGDARGVWDADRLGQVVQNLVSNALQHTTEDTRVLVRTRGEGDEVVLEVHNTGSPIAAEDMAKLFEPFQRGQGARRSGQSLGLGLHIASHIVRAHGGTISVRSNEVEGTTFTVRLPRVMRQQPEGSS